MGLTSSLLALAALLAASAFFSISEIALASARAIRLTQMADRGEPRAAEVLQVQRTPGSFFTVVQIGQNMVAILAGVVGDGLFSPFVTPWLQGWMGPEAARVTGFLASFLLVTSLFILFADLVPKRMALAAPETTAMRVLGPMRAVMALLRPAVWVFEGLSNLIVRGLGWPERRDDQITSADILALTMGATEAGVLHADEQQVIENLFELDTRNVESAMTARSRVVYLLLNDSEESLRHRIATQPHSTYLVCDGHIDRVVGYVDVADLFARMLQGEPIQLTGPAGGGLVRKVLVVPDRLTLSEMLTHFRQAHEDFACIVNEYSLTVGVITLNDVMSTVMGNLVESGDDEPQIVRRGDGSWLMDGGTPIVEVLRAIEADPESLPFRGQYDTLAGFLMVMLRRVPRRTDTLSWGGHRFEVMDVDSNRIDQVMVTPQAGGGAG